jgi:hypothetical protein
MGSISALICAALLLVATSVLAATTDSPRPAEAEAVASVSALPGAPALAPAPSDLPGAAKVSALTTDQILARLFGRRADDVVTKSGVGGAQVVDLEGRFSMVSIVVRNPDGTIGHFCVDNIGAASKLLAGPVSAPPVRAAVPPQREKISPLQ